MVFNKKLLAALFLTLAFSFSVISQNAEASSDSVNATEQQITNTIDETSYAFSSGTSSDNGEVERPVKSTGFTGTIISTLIAFVVIIFILWWVLRIIRKKTNLVKDNDDFLRRAAYITVGSGNKTVEVITLVDRAYVIGVSDDKITLLDEITDEKERDKDLIEAMNLNADKKQKVKKPVKFSEVLDMFTRKTGFSKTTETSSAKKDKSLFNSSESTLDELYKKANQEKTE